MPQFLKGGGPLDPKVPWFVATSRYATVYLSDDLLFLYVPTFYNNFLLRDRDSSQENNITQL